MTRWMYQIRGDEPQWSDDELLINLWTRRTAGWHLDDGDTVYVWRRETGVVAVETRVAALLRRNVDCVADYIDTLTAYGLLPEEMNANWTADDFASSPALVAWHPMLIGRLDLSLTSEQRDACFGAVNGLRAFDELPARVFSELTALLPAPGRPAAQAPSPLMAPHRIGGSRLRPTASRYISDRVRRLVHNRAGNRCEWPECDAVDDLHVDHRYPHSLGGGNGAGNLQILCRAHNLAKSDRVIGGQLPPPALPEIYHVADALDVPPNTPLSEMLTLAAARGMNLHDHQALESLAAHAIMTDAQPRLLADIIGLLHDRELVDLLWLVEYHLHGNTCALRILSGRWQVEQTLTGALIEATQVTGGPVRDALLASAAASRFAYVSGLAKLTQVGATEDPARQVSLLTEVSDGTDRWTAAEACWALVLRSDSDEEAMTWVRGVLVSPDPTLVGHATLWLATWMPTEPAMRTLERLTSSVDTEIAYVATEAVAQLKTGAASTPAELPDLFGSVGTWR